jgi:hypothetical protein
MNRHLLLIALLLSACGGAAESLASERASNVQPVAAVETNAAATHTLAPRPGAQAAAPAVIVTPEAADQIDALLAGQSGRSGLRSRSRTSGVARDGDRFRRSDGLRFARVRGSQRLRCAATRRQR